MQKSGRKHRTDRKSGQRCGLSQSADHSGAGQPKQRRRHEASVIGRATTAPVGGSPRIPVCLRASPCDPCRSSHQAGINPPLARRQHHGPIGHIVGRAVIGQRHAKAGIAQHVFEVMRELIQAVTTASVERCPSAMFSPPSDAAGLYPAAEIVAEADEMGHLVQAGHPPCLIDGCGARGRITDSADSPSWRATY